MQALGVAGLSDTCGVGIGAVGRFASALLACTRFYGALSFRLEEEFTELLWFFQRGLRGLSKHPCHKSCCGLCHKGLVAVCVCVCVSCVWF